LITQFSLHNCNKMRGLLMLWQQAKLLLREKNIYILFSFNQIFVLNE
jgi:hypothetical protein